MSNAEADSVVFSILYNETEEFLESIIDNFLRHTNDREFLIVNMQPDRTLSHSCATKSDRVLIFTGSQRRHKFGHTLLLGHLETFGYALHAIGRFDFFCTLASNSMFVRRFDQPAAISSLLNNSHTAADPENMPSWWWWSTVANCAPFTAFAKEKWGISRMTANQIEGLLASRDDWHYLFTQYASIKTVGELVPLERQFPFEEVLPSTFFTTFGSGRYTHICHVFWQRSNGGKVDILDLLDVGTKFPRHICLMKWFERNSFAIETFAVAEPWARDLIAGLVSFGTEGNTDKLLSCRFLVEKLGSILRSRETFVPLSKIPLEFGDGITRVETSFTEELAARKQIVDLPTARGQCEEDRAAAYLLFESTGHRLRLDISITENDVTSIHVQCVDLDCCPAEVSPLLLEAYLYVGPMRARAARMFRLRLPMQATMAQTEAVNRIVCTNKKHYWKADSLHVADVKAHREYYFRVPEPLADETVVWVGIPIFANAESHYLLDALPHCVKL